MCVDCCYEAGYCEGGCEDECGLSESPESREESLSEALANLSSAEVGAIRTVLKRSMPICVGTWAVDGTKQSYTCLMGTAACVMNDLTVGQFVSAYMERGGNINSILPVCELSIAGTSAVPEAFDNYFDAHPEYIVRSAGGETQLLNARGRAALKALLPA